MSVHFVPFFFLSFSVFFFSLIYYLYLRLQLCVCESANTYIYINGFVYVFMDVWLYGNLLRVQYLCGCVCGGDGQELDLTVPCSTCMSFVIHLKIKKDLDQKKEKKEKAYFGVLCDGIYESQCGLREKSA